MQCVFLGKLADRALLRLAVNPLKALTAAADCFGMAYYSLFSFYTSLFFLLLFLYCVNQKDSDSHNPQWYNGPHSPPRVCLIWEKKKQCVYRGAALSQELNWRWVLVSGFGQKNVHGPKDSWDVTPTPWAWFQLLCMSKTNHYICFYFMFCLRIEERGKNSGFSKK